VVLLVAGLISIVSGAIFFGIGKPHHLFGLIPVLFGLGVMFALVATLTVRSNRYIKLLRNGQQSATCPGNNQQSVEQYSGSVHFL